MRLLASLSLLVIAACGSANDPTRREIARAEFGDQWPFTVDAGELACVGPGTNVVFTADGTTYGVNGTAKGRGGYPPVDPIWKEQSLEDRFGKVQPLDKSPERQRRMVFRSLVACEDDARKAAERATSDFTAQPPIRQREEDRCKAALRRSEKLTAPELEKIGTEGAMKGWPPLTPTRVNIGPIIQAGLALCAS